MLKNNFASTKEFTRRDIAILKSDLSEMEELQENHIARRTPRQIENCRKQKARYLGYLILERSLRKVAHRPPKSEEQTQADYKMGADAVELLDTTLKQPPIQMAASIVLKVVYDSNN